MSGRVRANRERVGPAGAAIDTTTQSINEKILKECNELYTNKENGLVDLAAFLGLKLLAPRKKINILLIGNHSAGKSSFINWYIEKHVQKEGVAIETQGITFVTNGRKRETLTGNATLHLYPHFEPLAKVEGIMRYLSTEICDSIAKRFPLVTFIDTPGLVDGNMNYAFDVHKVINWLGNISDLVYIFFDPIGQALCKRTMTIVGQLGETHAERMHFYLSKSDEAGDETDRQRVLMQITQEVCKYPSLNRTCFDIQTIYNPNRAKPTRCVNQIDEAAKVIEKTIQLTIQNTLNQLQKDCHTIEATVTHKLEQDRKNKKANWKSFFQSILLYMGALSMPILLLLTLFAHKPSDIALVTSFLGPELTNAVVFYMRPLTGIYAVIPDDYCVYVLAFYMLMILIVFMIAKYVGRTHRTLTRKEKRKMTEISEYVQELVKTKKHSLYEEYLKQSIKEHDL